MSISPLHGQIDELYEKYKDNNIMKMKLESYVMHILPQSLLDYEKNYAEREKRKLTLSHKSEEFIHRFIAKNNIYYTPQNELFVQYTGKRYIGYSEDNIQHNILTQITINQELRPWKHKIKNNIIKRIKKRSPLDAIPDSHTIQYVINQLCPAMFPTKNRAKYFLTIIGDCLLHKHASELIYIAHPYLKTFIGEISVQAHAYFGANNAFHQIKYKFYDHNFKSSRLLSVMHKLHATNPWNMYKHMLDLLCVAAHYSLRYTSADIYLQKCRDTTLKKHALYLTHNTSQQITKTFLKDYVIKSENSEITKKNMIFIWKKFLDTLDIPNIIFHGSLHTIFQKQLEYDETKEAYIGVTSVYLPTMATFLTFWKDTIKEDDDSEIEVEEALVLFQKWEKENKQKNPIMIDYDICVDLIKHFYPDVIIEDDKFILNISCNIWNKREEVIVELERFKQKCATNHEIEPSLNGAYQYYATTAVNKELVISKRFFEKVALEVLEKYIDDDGLIDSTWFT